MMEMPGWDLGHEKHKTYIFKGLAGPILIKIGKMFHFEMLFTIIEKKKNKNFRFWLSSRLLSPFFQFLVLTTATVELHPPNA